MKRSPRVGFTLIELLAVILIIVVLMGLSAGAYFKVRKSQEEGATRTTIQKVDQQLNAQFRTVLDNCRDDAKMNKIPVNVSGLANNDNRRALAIWTKMKLKLEFPQNFHEAITWPKQMKLMGMGIEKSPYIQAFTKPLPIGEFVPRDPSLVPMTDEDLRNESAVLLYLACVQARRGVTGFDPGQHVGSHAVDQITINDANGVPWTFKIFKDTWERPIGFIRWPFGGGNSDLNTRPFAQADNAGRIIDAQDPERTLYGNDWYSLTPGGFKAQFEQIVGHPLQALNPQNLAPVVFSSGRDKLLGFSMQPVNAFQYASPEEDDNVYGYRMRGEGGNN